MPDGIDGLMNPAGHAVSEQKRRRSPRARVFLSATLECPERALPVVLRNLSEHGALLEGTGFVRSDCECRLRRKDLCVEGRIAWINGKFAGLAFTTCLSPQVVMEHVGQPSIRPVAEPVHRRPGVTQRQMSREERRWFEEMSRR
jgi:hypothetical protein